MNHTGPLGPLMLDLEQTHLSAAERDLLQEPEVGGVILFGRNFTDLAQLHALVQDIRSLRPDLLLAVDHEGGRVQRFRTGFTRLPPMGRLGQVWQQDPVLASEYAFSCGWLLAAELLAVGIDFSFAPVLDREYGRSRVIGDRAFSTDPLVILALAEPLMKGMHAAGMATVGKHFPGHGWVEADSHVDIPRDMREEAVIVGDDMTIFSTLMGQNLVDAIMPAHVIYERVDPVPAGFSHYWLQTLLRGQLGFDGVIFSDDLNMEGAGVAGSYGARAEAALTAGCDMALVCNNRPGALEALQTLKTLGVQPNQRLARMRGRQSPGWDELRQSEAWQHHCQRVDACRG